MLLGRQKGVSRQMGPAMDGASQPDSLRISQQDAAEVTGISQVPDVAGIPGADTIVEDFAQVVARFEAPLLRYARQLVGSVSAEAQDIVQETFLRLHRHRDSARARDIRHLSTWLYRVTHNLAMDVLRRRARQSKGRQRLQQRPPAADPGLHLMEMERQELAGHVMRMLRQLPRDQRAVLTLKFLENLSIRQIARVVNQSPSNVAYHLNKALGELTRRLKDSGAI